jgi:hypothetical protein
VQQNLDEFAGITIGTYDFNLEVLTHEIQATELRR